jgi:hypothetical protein
MDIAIMLEYVLTLVGFGNMIVSLRLIFMFGRFIGTVETRLSDVERRTSRQEERCDAVCLSK